MKKIKLLFKIIFIVYLTFGWGGWIVAYGQNSPIEIELTMNQPPPGKLTDFLDLPMQFQARITNNTNEEQTVFFSFTIDGLRGEAAGLKAIFNEEIEFPIPVNGITVTPADLQIYYSMVSGSDFQTTYRNAAQENLVEQGYLPQGTYRICGRAFDSMTGEELSIFGLGNCDEFTVIYYNPPQFITPTGNPFDGNYDSNQSAFNEEDNVFFSWTNDWTNFNANDVTYELEIKELPTHEATYNQQNGTIPQEYFNALPEVAAIEDIPTLQYNSTDDLVPFNAGNYYAVRVTAKSENIQFRNQGRSDIVVFQYGGESENTSTKSTIFIQPLCGGFNQKTAKIVFNEYDENWEGTDAEPCVESKYEVLSAFPVEEDTLPFTQMPMVLKFAPYCDTYSKFIFSHSIIDKSGGDFYTRKNGNNTQIENSWPQGALFELQKTFSNATAFQAQHLQLNKQSEQNDFVRGDAYTMEATTLMNVGEKDTYRSNLSTKFNVGMPTPNPIGPVNEAKIAPGEVIFEWNTGRAPKKIVPPFHLAQKTGNGPITYSLLSDVKEFFVVQLSTNNDFSSVDTVVAKGLLEFEHNTLNNSTNDPSFFEEEKMLAALYKNLNKTIKLHKEGTYYWRILYLNNPEQPPADLTKVSSSEYYRTSPTFQFSIDKSVPPQEEPTGTCVSACKASAVTDKVAVAGLEEEDVFSYGKFKVKVTEVTNSSGTTFSGKGEVKLNFLNDARILVRFSNIQKNQANQAFTGSLTVQKDREFGVSDINTVVGKLTSMTGEVGKEIDSYLTQGDRLLSLLTGDRAIGLPIGIDKDIQWEGNSYAKITIGITDMKFNLDSAKLRAVVNLEIPSLQNFGQVGINGANLLPMGGADLCFSPDGFGNEGKIFLVRSQKWDLGNGMEFHLAGALNAKEEEDICFVNWDCNGFKCLNLASKWVFPRDMIVPDDPVTGEPKAEGQVEAIVAFKACSGANFMGKISMEDFQIADAPGWGFNVEDAYIDISDLQNPPNFEENLPKDYKHNALDNPRLKNHWQGFFLKAVNVRMPKKFENHVKRTAFGVHNFIIDKTGLTFNFRVDNVIKWEEKADIEGWAFSLDTVFMDVVQTSFKKAGLRGKIGLPIAEERDYLAYKAALVYESKANQNDKSLAFNFTVKNKDDIDIPLAIARATILDGTYIKVNLQDNNSYLEVKLNADLAISDEHVPDALQGEMAASLKMPKLHIENFIYNSKYGIVDDRPDEKFSYKLNSPQKSMSGFPLTLEGFKFGNDGGDVFLEIKPKLTIAGSKGNGISAAAGIKLKASLFGQGRFNFKLKGIELSEVDIEGKFSENFTIKGMVKFYKSGNKKGMQGMLQANLPMDICIGLSAEFGTYREEGATVYDTPNWYGYWFVEGVAVLPGITIFSGLDLYGLGGGAYSRMTQTSTKSSIDGNKGAVSALCGTGAGGFSSYANNFNTYLGVKFMLLLGSTGDNGEAYNFDIGLEMEFYDKQQGGGLKSIGFKGNIRVLTEGVGKTSSDGYPVQAYIEAKYQRVPEVKTIEAVVLVRVDFDGIIEGTGNTNSMSTNIVSIPPNMNDKLFVNAHFKSKKYEGGAGQDEMYFHMGQPDNRGGLKIPGIFTMDSYLMIGDGLPSTIPPPSKKFQEIYFGKSGKVTQSGGGTDITKLLEGQPISRSNLAQGFAFGLSAEFDFSTPPGSPFYIDLECATGLDVNITKSAKRVCGNNPSLRPGVNHWYATGQFYLGIQGSIGLDFTLGFLDWAKVEILGASAAMVVAGGIPNPTWAQGDARIRYRVLGGLISGSTEFEFELGDVCIPQGSHPFEGIDVIQDLEPNGGDKHSIYTSPIAAFAVSLEETYFIPVENDWKNELSPKKIKFYIHDFSIKAKNGEAIFSNYKFDNDGTSAILTPKQTLAGLRDYDVKIVVRCKDLRTNKDILYEGAVWQEIQEVSFKTGAAPSTLVPDDIELTYPFDGQRYFLQTETTRREGFIGLKRWRSDNILKTSIGNDKYRFIANFMPLIGGTRLQSSVTLHPNEKTIRFPIPKLDNSTFYLLQIQKIKIKPAGIPDFGEKINPSDRLGNQGQISNKAIQNPQVLLTEQYYEFKEVLASTQSGQDATPAKRELPGPVVRTEYNQQILYYYFRTSKFDNLREKLTGVNFRFKEHSTFGGIDVITVLGQLTEDFDEYEISHYHQGGLKKFKGLIKIDESDRHNSNESSYYRRQKYLPFVLKPYYDFNRLKTEYGWPNHDFSPPRISQLKTSIFPINYIPKNKINKWELEAYIQNPTNWENWYTAFDNPTYFPKNFEVKYLVGWEAFNDRGNIKRFISAAHEVPVEIQRGLGYNITKKVKHILQEEKPAEFNKQINFLKSDNINAVRVPWTSPYNKHSLHFLFLKPYKPKSWTGGNRTEKQFEFKGN